MTELRKKIAQMLIFGFPDAHMHPQAMINQWLNTAELGGVILFDENLPKRQFGKNLYDIAQIQQLTSELQQRNASNLRLLIALDYEGGHVDRLKRIEGCPATLTPKAQAALSEEEFIREIDTMALTLKSLGFNLNFAPVVDLALNDQAGIIGRLGRSFSSNPERVADLAKQFIQRFTAQNIVCCYKHFPGHGSAIGDTHEGFVDVSATYSPQEIVPYQSLIADDDSVMVMTAHVINRQLDPTGLPATLSYPILTGLLRKEFGFNGVIISDDLQMQAISDHFSLEEALKLTLNAGADMVIFGNQLGEHEPGQVIDCIEALVTKGAIPESRIDEAFSRIVTLKQKMI